jgi:hypothetical protein
VGWRESDWRLLVCRYTLLKSIAIRYMGALSFHEPKDLKLQKFCNYQPSISP